MVNEMVVKKWFRRATLSLSSRGRPEAVLMRGIQMEACGNAAVARTCIVRACSMAVSVTVRRS